MAEYHEIIRSLKERKYATVYFLEGEEPHFIDQISDEIEKNVLDEAQKSFNQYILYGKETQLATVINRCRQFPMMGDKQVVIVKEAQELFGFKDENQQQLLLGYLEKPLESTILVFAHKYKTLDKRNKLGKVLASKSVYLTTKKIYDNQVPDWIAKHCANLGLKISQKAIMLLAEHIGNNLQRLANEIDKLSINVPKDQIIEENTIHRYVGINKEYNVFELQKAIGTGNFNKALKICLYFGANTSANPLIPLLMNLFNYFSKLLLIQEKGISDQNAAAKLIGVNPYFVSEYLDACRRYNIMKIIINLQLIQTADLQAKGIAFAGGKEKDADILKDLIFQLMH